MEMTSVTFENYRGFEKYTLDGLARVNLLVGENNCGKTAILEGIHFLASQGDPGVLSNIAISRGESIKVEYDEDDMILRNNRKVIRTFPIVRYFFHGRTIAPNQFINIKTDYISTCATVTKFKKQDAGIIDSNYESLLSLTLKIETEKENFESRSTIALTDDGIIIEPFFLYPQKNGLKQPPTLNIINTTHENAVKVFYLSPISLSIEELSAAWNKIISEGKDSAVGKAMTIIEPRLTNVFFLSRSTQVFNNYTGILVELDNRDDQRIPLGNFGDGMRRLLTLAIIMIQNSNGIVLIDEIDTGLHFSIMSDLWQFVIETARKSNIQVFATTHSLDCIRGLAECYRKHPEYVEDISLQRIVPKLEKSVAFNARNIEIAMHQNVEVR
jgi:hypothetical protein